jgi:hypothetical protein
MRCARSRWRSSIWCIAINCDQLFPRRAYARALRGVVAREREKQACRTTARRRARPPAWPSVQPASHCRQPSATQLPPDPRPIEKCSAAPPQRRELPLPISNLINVIAHADACEAAAPDFSFQSVPGALNGTARFPRFCNRPEKGVSGHFENATYLTAIGGEGHSCPRYRSQASSKRWR